MPIPIPIPVPMGPPPPIPKPFHHHQQHQQHDGEGEVKKIYLLQPMPKQPPPPPNLKGPIQTHIHLQPPMVTHPIKSIPRTRVRPYENDYVDQPRKHDSMKILPIVVIPPIAPMPPIQLPNSGSGATKMSLTPQFNNYIVSDRRKPSHKLRTFMNQLQDQQNFGDYNEANSDRIYRSYRRGRYSSRTNPYITDREYGLSRNRDDDELGPVRRSRTTYSNGRYGSSGRRSTGKGLRNQHDAARIKSIRDILDQQIQFDDDPSGSDFGQVDGTLRDELKADYDDLPVQYQGQRASGDYRSGTTNVYNRAQQSSDFSFDDAPLEKSNKEDKQSQNDLSPYYHTRDVLEDSARNRYEQDQLTRSREERPAASERDPLDEDEWRFDTIKSVAHLAPNKTDLAQNTTTSKPQGPFTITNTTSTEPPTANQLP